MRLGHLCTAAHSAVPQAGLAGPLSQRTEAMRGSRRRETGPEQMPYTRSLTLFWCTEPVYARTCPPSAAERSHAPSPSPSPSPLSAPPGSALALRPSRARHTQMSTPADRVHQLSQHIDTISVPGSMAQQNGELLRGGAVTACANRGWHPGNRWLAVLRTAALRLATTG